MDYLSAAIQKLRPNSEFTYFGEDYSTIQWIVLQGEAPTLDEVETAIEEVKADEIEQAKIQAKAKADLLNKLGISAAEAALLLK
jgi:hypothetical protein